MSIINAFKKTKTDSGQTLVEILVAFGIASIVIGSLTFAIIKAASTTHQSNNQNVAAQFAQDGIELVRNQRDANWGTFNAIGDGTYCFADLGPGQICPFDVRLPVSPLNTTQHECGYLDSQDATAYQLGQEVGQCSSINQVSGKYLYRVIQIKTTSNCEPPQPPSPTPTPVPVIGKQVTVSVFWTSSDCTLPNVYCKKVQLDTCLTNSNVEPTP